MKRTREYERKVEEIRQNNWKKCRGKENKKVQVNEKK